MASLQYVFSPSSSRASRLTLFSLGTPKEIPRFQRRGAIIVLAMFAAPKPEVVAEHVETLLKIGLGPHGKVRSSLAADSSSSLTPTPLL